MRESEAMAVLVAAKGVGYVRREHALNAAGSALAVISDPAAYAAQLGQEGVTALRRSVEAAESLLCALGQDDVHLIVQGSEGYPPLLAQTARPPHLLFVRGGASLHDRFPLAIVGTRRADSYGLRHTHAFASALAEAGMCIVSGLALGIDAQAHEGALEAQGRTIAVLGSALDRMYPPENRALMERILAAGGSIVSEYPPGTPPTRYSFLERNRIIAGLSLGVLVTRAPGRSGALSTAQRALDEGREVFAIPGDIDRIGSQLPNRLIAEGAHAALSPQDILSQLVIEPDSNAAEKRPERAKKKRMAEKAAAAQDIQTMAEGEKPVRGETPAQAKAPASPSRSLDAQERAVYDLLSSAEMSFDELCERTEIGSVEMGSILMMLELDGMIEALAGNLYRLV